MLTVVIEVFRELILRMLGADEESLSSASSVMDLTKDGARMFCVLLAEPVADILAATVTTLTFPQFYRTQLKKENS